MIVCTELNKAENLLPITFFAAFNFKTEQGTRLLYCHYGNTTIKIFSYRNNTFLACTQKSDASFGQVHAILSAEDEKLEN